MSNASDKKTQKDLIKDLEGLKSILKDAMEEVGDDNEKLEDLLDEINGKLKSIIDGCSTGMYEGGH